MRLEQMRQTLRSAFARRGKETVAGLAIAGTLAAMFFTAHQVHQGWAQRRTAAEGAVRDNLMTAAVLIGTEAAKMSGLELRALLWPVLGTNGWPSARPLTLDGFARAGSGVFATMSDRDAARPGYFRLTRQERGAWKAELRGALATDSAYARAVLDEVRRWTSRVNVDSPSPGIAIVHPNSGGVPVIVGMAPERAADGHVVALFGVSYARSVALRTHVGHVLQGVSLLPARARERGDSIPRGVDAGQTRAAPGQSTGEATKVDNSSLAVRLRYATGFRDAISSAAADDRVWRSAFVATRAIGGLDGGFTVEVALPEVVGQRYVAAAMPTRSEQLMLGGVLLLGIGFAAAAALGLRRQYKLAEARRTFVAAVSHELRTPLAHVNALSETLLLGRAETPEQAQRWLRAIHREGRRLSVLTENVLLHARGEQRGIRAAPQWTDIGAVVQDAVSLVEAQAVARCARIVVDAPPLGSAGVWVDPVGLRQIVINLIENALKFGPDGQTVTVTLDLERAATPGGVGGRLLLCVDDEGPGVSPADRDRIWQPFVRLGEDGNAPPGTGLGLSVVRQLVVELGGRWSVGDAPRRGARFRVEVPLPGHTAPLGDVPRVVKPATPSPAQRRPLASTGR